MNTLFTQNTLTLGNSSPMSNGSAAGLTLSWAGGVLVKDGQIISGTYDTNKTWEDDSELCWVAAASNLLAWWQDVTGNSSSSAEAIFASLKEFTDNISGYADEACQWWLSSQGESGYRLSYHNAAATNIAEELASHFAHGGAAALNIYRHEGGSLHSGHALTLWGISRDADTGELAAIHVSDSDDGREGSCTIALAYDTELGYYRLLGEEYEGYCIGSYTLLAAATPGQDAREAFSGYTLGEQGEPPASLYSFLAAAEAANAALTLRTGATGASYSYAWTLGIISSGGTITGGFYDADKLKAWSTAAGDDGNMCWAGAASNMIAWWQNYYGAYYSVSTNPALTVDRIFDTFRLYWINEGGWAEAACQWWLAGGSNTGNYNSLIRDHGKPFNNGAGYYTRFFDKDDVSQIAYNINVTGKTASDLAGEIATKFSKGCCVSIAIGKYVGTERSMGHALTLWGITRDASTGVITTLHFTDSNDKTDNNGKPTVVKINVKYSNSTKRYILQSGAYKGWQLDSYQVLAPFTNNSVLNPHNLKATQSKGKVVFSWTGEQRKGLIYQVAYKKTGESKYTYAKSSSKSLTLALPGSGTYIWAVRALGGSNALTKWVFGSNISYDITPPAVSFSKPFLVRAGSGKSTATFTWSSTETAYHKLVLNNQVVYNKSGKGTSLSFTLANGDYNYTLTVWDSKGNTTQKKGSFECNSAVVNKPGSLKVQLQNQGRKALFSWGAVSNPYGVTYQLACKRAGASSYTIYTAKTNSFTLNLKVDDIWNWRVRTIDGNGYASDWKAGQSFNNDLTAPTISLKSPGWKIQGKNSTSVTFLWSSNESASYTLHINGKKYYSGTGTSRSYTLKDGTYSYTVTAKDASGNISSKSGKFICDTAAPTRPSGLSVKVYKEGERAIFTWKAVSDVSGVTYQFELRKQDTNTYTRYGDKLKSPTMTMRLGGITTRYWRVRAVDGRGNVSAWVQGESFYNDLVPPKITFKTPVLKKLSSGKSAVTFNWSADKNVTYILELNGKQVYKGKGTSRKFTLKDGTHKYKLTAVDALGNKSSKSGSLRCDTIAPPKPTGLKFSLKNKGGTVDFSWNASTDASGVTYKVGIKFGSDPIEYYDNYKAAKASFNLLVTGNWTWYVRSIDGKGNASAWVRGKNFNNDLTAPKITLASPVCKKSATGKSTVTFSWSTNETASYILTIDDKQVYKGKGTSRSFTLADGLHKYTLTAIDAAGNKSSKSGSVRCDTIAPPKPSALSLQLTNQGAGVNFNWKAVSDVSGVTYEVAIQYENSNLEYFDGYKSASASFTLNVKGAWKWYVRAVDGKGNASAWVQGLSFKNTLTRSVSAPLTASSGQQSQSPAPNGAADSSTAPRQADSALNLDRELALSAGLDTSSLGYSPCANTACSTLLGPLDSLEEKQLPSLAAPSL